MVWTDITTVQVPRSHIGVAAVAAMFREHGCEVQLYVPLRLDIEEFLALVERYDPDTVAFSSMTPQFCYTSQLAQALKLVRPEVLTVIGGAHASYAPQEVIANEAYDVLCRAEGEMAVTQIALRDPRPEALADVQNLWVRMPDGEVIRNPIGKLFGPLDDLPYVARDIFDYPAVLDSANGEMCTMGSRGCPYVCDYCCSPTFNVLSKGQGKVVRRYSVTRVVDEIVSVVERWPQVETVYFIDDIFAPSWEWLEEFRDQYPDRVGRPFRVLLRVECAKPRMIGLLAEAGCYHIDYGVESGSEWLRRHIQNRTMSNDQIEEAFALTRDHDIRTNALMMVGMPQETPEMVQESNALLERLDPDEVTPSIFYPFPGTRLYDLCKDEGWLTDRWASDPFQTSILNLPTMSTEEIVRWFHQFTEQGFARAAQRHAQGVFDFLANLDQASVESPWVDDVKFGYFCKTWGRTPWLFAPPPCSLEFDVELPPAARLAFCHGMRHAEGVDPPLDAAVEFSVRIDGELVYRRRRKVGELHALRPWDAAEVDLSRWAGQRIRLSFLTTPHGDLSQTYACGWGGAHLEGARAVEAGV